MTDVIDGMITQFSTDDLQLGFIRGDLLSRGYIPKPGCKKCYGRGYIGRDETKMRGIYKLVKSGKQLSYENITKLLEGLYVPCGCIRRINVDLPNVQKESQDGVSPEVEASGSVDSPPLPASMEQPQEDQPQEADDRGNESSIQDAGRVGADTKELAPETTGEPPDETPVAVEKSCKQCGGMMQHMGGEYWECEKCGMFRDEEKQVTFGGAV